MDGGITQHRAHSVQEATTLFSAGRRGRRCSSVNKDTHGASSTRDQQKSCPGSEEASRRRGRSDSCRGIVVAGRLVVIAGSVVPVDDLMRDIIIVGIPLRRSETF